jgi:hypothetical protein
VYLVKSTHTAPPGLASSTRRSKVCHAWHENTVAERQLFGMGLGWAWDEGQRPIAEIRMGVEELLSHENAPHGGWWWAM